MQTIIDNILLNYEIFGEKNNNSILILHGWKNSLKNWEEVAKNLSDKNKVILLDLPGMGNSTLPKKILDTYDYATIVSSFIEKLKLKKLILLGHSFGGKFSMVITSKNENIQKLIVVDPSGITNRSLSTNLKIVIFKILKPFSVFAPKIIKNKIINLLSSEDYKNAGELKESFKKIVKQDITESIKKIKIPTLIIWGEKDTEVPLSSAKKIQALIPNSSIRIVWKVGHHPHLEKPNKFIEIVEEFV